MIIYNDQNRYPHVILSAAKDLGERASLATHESHLDHVILSAAKDLSEPTDVPVALDPSLRSELARSEAKG